MGKLQNTGIALGGAGLGYVGLKAAAESGVETAQIITQAVENTASEALNVLEGAFSEIGSLAPVSQVFIDELSGVLVNTSLVDAGLATGAGLAAGWVGKKGSQILGKITGVESEHDNSVSKYGIGGAGALGVLGASASAITIGSGTVGYVLGRKLGEKILGEKYAKYTAILGAVGGAGISLGASSGAILGLSATAIGAGFIWNGLGVSDNWKRQSERRKSQGVLKTHFGIGRTKKS